MAKHDDIPKTDPSEIEALIKRLKRSGHGRMAASAYTGAKVVICRHPDFKSGTIALTRSAAAISTPLARRRFSFSSRGSRWWARRITNKKCCDVRRVWNASYSFSDATLVTKSFAF
jgi:hypothetical protein